MKTLWNLGKPLNFCMELFFLKLSSVQSFLSLFLSCLLSSQCVYWEAKAAALCSERHSTSKAGIQHVPFCTGKHALKVQETRSEAAKTICFFSLSQLFVIALLPALPTALPGEGAECLCICLQWYFRALLSPACRLICKQAVSLGSRNMFFLNPRQIYSLVSCQIFAFSSSAPPSLWHTFSHFLCRSLLILTPVHLLPLFLILHKLSAHLGPGSVLLLVFPLLFNSCRAQITSPGLLERRWQLHGGNIGTLSLRQLQQDSLVTHEHPR